MKKKDFRAAFALGFLVSKEGFNGECPCEHLAPEPKDISRHWPEDHISGMTLMLSQMPEFTALVDAAWGLQARAHGWIDAEANDFIDATSDGHPHLIPREPPVRLKIDLATGAIEAIVPAVWTARGFTGHYPVGTAAVVVADTEAEAIKALGDQLALDGMPQDKPLEVQRLPLKAGTVRVLVDGNY